MFHSVLIINGEKRPQLLVASIYIDFYAVKYELSLMGSQNIGQIPWNTNVYLIVFIASVFGWTETKLKEINCFKVYKTYSFSHKNPLYAINGFKNQNSAQLLKKVESNAIDSYNEYIVIKNISTLYLLYK